MELFLLQVVQEENVQISSKATVFVHSVDLNTAKRTTTEITIEVAQDFTKNSSEELNHSINK